ncbi:hypothetical protein GF324_07290 [bacterium]|nr:hypothetical protein [bacterium]
MYSQSPGCKNCQASLSLENSNDTYKWVCDKRCDIHLDTKIEKNYSVNMLSERLLKQGKEDSSIRIETAFIMRPILDLHIKGIRIFMPQILYHFIECTWFACYYRIYENVIVPYLDDVEVLAYVLNTNVVREDTGAWIGKTGGKMYSELYYWLVKV